jgi:dipeptidase E
MPKHIVAIGGAGFEAGTPDAALYRYLIDLTGKERPRAAFLPQASCESRGYGMGFQSTFERLGCRTSCLSLFWPHTADVRGYLLEQDLIYVGGGNTKSMLALWREWGLDRFLTEANANGTVLAGLSAGSICWFEQGVTDSIPGTLTALPCLGYLSGSFCPHYDSEPRRQPSYTKMVADGTLAPGYAADDGAGLHFLDGVLHCAIVSRPSARAFRVYAESGEAVEERLEASPAGESMVGSK